MPRRARAAATPRRQTDIADALLRIAGREGIGSLTMARLAREVGVTSGALFRHFPSRAAMLDEAAARAVALLETTFPPPGLPPRERMRWFLAARVALVQHHPGVPQLIFSEQFRKALPPSGARALRAMVRRSFDFVCEALAEGAARGEVRRDIPPADLAATILGTLLVRVFLVATLPDLEPLDAESAWSMISRLAAPPA